MYIFNVSTYQRIDMPTFARLQLHDIDEHYQKVLAQVGDMSGMTVEDMRTAYTPLLSNPDLQMWVMRDDNGRLVATGTLLLEKKLYRGGKWVGHIEDICVDPTRQGEGLGKKMIHFLTETAAQKQCYKVILDCKPDLETFYKKCDFVCKNIQMSYYF